MTGLPRSWKSHGNSGILKNSGISRKVMEFRPKLIKVMEKSWNLTSISHSVDKSVPPRSNFGKCPGHGILPFSHRKVMEFVRVKFGATLFESTQDLVFYHCDNVMVI